MRVCSSRITNLLLATTRLRWESNCASDMYSQEKTTTWTKSMSNCHACKVKPVASQEDSHSLGEPQVCSRKRRSRTRNRKCVYCAHPSERLTMITLKTICSGAYNNLGQQPVSVEIPGSNIPENRPRSHVWSFHCETHLGSNFSEDDLLMVV
jgi:hypothetical protein